MAQAWSKRLSAEDGKNVHYQVNGVVGPGERVLDWVTVIETKEGSLRLDAVRYAISDKLEILLAWDKEGGDPHVFLPLAARGGIDFDAINGVRNTVGEGKSGNVLLCAYALEPSSHSRHFTLMLDFSKQGI